MSGSASSSPREIAVATPVPSRGRSRTPSFLRRLRNGPLGRSRFFPVAACALTVVIFSIDTFTRLGVAVAVLYALVVLIAAGLLQRRGVLFVSIACVFLTVLSYVISHGTDPSEGAVIRAGMSLSAILATTILALRYHSAGLAVQERAELLDLTHDAVFVRDMGGTVTYWNRGAEELYGWSKAQANGQDFHDLVRTTFPIPLETVQAELMRTGRWQGELAQIRADGRRIAVASRWALRRDERGRAVGILETNTDITARLDAREALHRAQAELAHVTRVTTLGELTASIAHEVNQPLAAIVANGQACLRWLKRDVPDLGEAQSAVERMVADGKRAGEVIWGLRMLARKADPQWDVQDLNEIIDSALVLVQRELLGHRVALKLSLSPDLPPVCGDRVQLQQVIINLMVNGMQAMGAVDDRSRTLLVATQRHEADQVLVQVKDAGTGISDENLDRLFHAFFTTRADGMGMGLSICRSIVEAHGGRIWASRNDGPGATMQFTLPIIEEKTS